MSRHVTKSGRPKEMLDEEMQRLLLYVFAKFATAPETGTSGKCGSVRLQIVVVRHLRYAFNTATDLVDAFGPEDDSINDRFSILLSKTTHQGLITKRATSSTDRERSQQRHVGK